LKLPGGFLGLFFPGVANSVPVAVDELAAFPLAGRLPAGPGTIRNGLGADEIRKNKKGRKGGEKRSFHK